MKFKELYPFFTETIFNREDRSWKNPVKRTLVRIYKLIFYMVRGMLNHGTLIRSAAMTYYTITSLVPIVAVAFALVKVSAWPIRSSDRSTDSSRSIPR